ncbi:unnamed protein product [Enterobius vermicularis]|uniref:Glycosyltransferase family 92 protein n=1 Tax=Enterobius vermicularis TaxID=51028 RepID=A0A0N4VKL7_ENTVE|nr:unnamed protein product [Enterobius vermicularis]
MLKLKKIYLMLVEDDAAVIPDFIPLVTSVIKQMNRKTNIDYVKLFHPVHLRGIPYYFQLFLFERFTFQCFRSILNLKYQFAVYFKLFFADIRYSITNSAYLVAPESCCTVAVLYRTFSLPKMLHYFKNLKTNGLPKDDLLDASPFEGRMTDTNLMVHIGYYSAIRNKIVVLDTLKRHISATNFNSAEVLQQAI